MRSWCESPWVVWAGAAGTGKSADAAVMALQYWLEQPDQTAVVVTSTTKEMLRRRIWHYIAHYHSLLTQKKDTFGYVGELIDTGCKIRWSQGDDTNCIFGVAVGEGSVEEAVNNLVGVHPKRYMLILDEFQGVREAIMGGVRNMAKNPEFLFRGLGNPEDKGDIMGRYSEPKTGWDSITLGTDSEWEVHPGPSGGKGLCEMFYATDSPAIKEENGVKKYPFLINQEQIDNDLAFVRGNVNDPKYQSQTLGIWPAMGLLNVVLDSATISAFKCKDRSIWTHGFKEGASLDPAFEDGGDSKILQFLRWGWVDDSLGARWVIEFKEWIDVPIDSNSKIPVHYQIVHYCRDKCKERGIPSTSFASDSSGEGGGLAAIFEQEWGPIVAVEFGGKPSEMPVKTSIQGEHEETLLANQVYDRRVSELNLMVREFAMSNGIRGLSDDAASQFSSRKTFYKNKKYSVESKKEMKKRIRRSPDHADAACVGVELARRDGCSPSISVAGGGSYYDNADWMTIVKKADAAHESFYSEA